MNANAYRLLALCARARCDAADHEKIVQAASQLEDWRELLVNLKDHRMGPLVYVHLKDAGVDLPDSIRYELQSLYVQHRWADKIRNRVLREILSAFQATAIPVVALKGAALSNLVYPQSVLRPMSDLDLLVPRAEVWRAGQTLSDLGFDLPIQPDQKLVHRHLPIAVRRSEGLLVAVEIHHQLMSNYFDTVRAHLRHALAPLFGVGEHEEDPTKKRELTRDAGERNQDENWSTINLMPFTVDDVTAYSLRYEDLLSHVCLHLISHVNVWDHARLIWMSDLVSIAEYACADIDWAEVKRTTPVVLDTLSLLHFSTPLTNKLIKQAGIEIGHTPQGIGQEFQGWPRVTRAEWRKLGVRDMLRQTLFPSEWWLRLRYSRGSYRSIFWYRWVRHPLHILAQVVRALLERFGWPSPLDLVKD